MKKFVSYAAVFALGCVVSLASFMAINYRDKDLLSEAKGYSVKTKHDLVLIDENNNKFTLPKGTYLKFISQYRREGTFELKIISSDLNGFEKTDKQAIYYQYVQSSSKD